MLQVHTDASLGPVIAVVADRQLIAGGDGLYRQLRGCPVPYQCTACIFCVEPAGAVSAFCSIDRQIIHDRHRQEVGAVEEAAIDAVGGNGAER
ncbi:hypothetical protein D3C73_1430610 [compost metagenome]